VKLLVFGWSALKLLLETLCSKKVNTCATGHTATASGGFHLRFGIGNNKDKPETGGQLDGNQPEENAVNGSATPPKKPQRPSSAADAKSPASAKSPTCKTNLRIFEIMASSPNGSAGKNSTETNGDTAAESPRRKISNVAAAETSVFCPVGPPAVSPVTASLGDAAGHRAGQISQSTGGTVTTPASGVKLRHPLASTDNVPPVNITNTKYMVTVAIDFG
jgi:hypothetical protein